MKLYRFKTFRTSYYFPRMTKELEFMYELYAAYGGRLSKAYWWLFRHCQMIRLLNGIETEKLEFPFQQISELEGNRSLMAFNLGTPGEEQKISILGFNSDKNEAFFAKYSEKPKSKELTRNEIQIYTLLQDTGLTPTLYDYKITEDYVWMKTSCIKGKHYPTMQLTEEVLAMVLTLSKYHLNNQNQQNNGLKTCLAHGDFCPWNILVDNNNIKLIDWEMAAEKPLGYDLFKYVCQCSRLFTPNKPYERAIEEQQWWINRYFEALQIADWTPYLSNFLSTNSWN